LATYLASQDNPENGLCPNLRPPQHSPDSIESLTFLAIPKPRPRDDCVPPTSPKAQAIHSRPGSPKSGHGSRVQPVATRSSNGTASGDRKEKTKPASPRNKPDAVRQSRRPGFIVTEEPVSKDHRSFAANVFGTVAFKMLEWLTPAAMREMSEMAQGFRNESESEDGESRPETATKAGQPKSPHEVRVVPAESNAELVNGRSQHEHSQTERETRPAKDTQQPHEPFPASRASNPRRNSNAKVRPPSGTKPKRQLSIDPYAKEGSVEEPYAALLRSPRAIPGPADKGSRGPKTAGSTLSRPISQLSSAGFFDDVSLEKMPPSKSIDFKSRNSRSHLDGSRSSELGSPQQLATGSGASSSRSCSNGSMGAANQDAESEDESHLPQALSRLDARVIDFVCDVLQEDGTAEKHLLEPQSVTKFHNRQAGQGKLARRKRRSARSRLPNLRLEWKLFAEQSFFYVLSDPQLALRSFTKQGQLYDSQTLWYCMLRLTRTAPSLVFHSLWMAAASLFAPPKSLQTLRSPTTKVFPTAEPGLSNLEAGRLMSICLHALIAAAPLVTDSRQLYDMSRIRSHGLSLAGSGAVARQPTELCLQYEDAFTNDMAMRLARRLFAAITTRRCFDELSRFSSGGDEDHEQDILAPLFSQLDLLNMDAVYILDFSFPDRALHETRVPILLLDWARAVMLHDWDGSPEVSGDSPFGGALALIEAMCKSTNRSISSTSLASNAYRRQETPRATPSRCPVPVRLFRGAVGHGQDAHLVAISQADAAAAAPSGLPLHI
jgi:hypothetical protein